MSHENLLYITLVKNGLYNTACPSEIAILFFTNQFSREALIQKDIVTKVSPMLLVTKKGTNTIEY